MLNILVTHISVCSLNQVDENTILAVRLYQVASGGNILLREWQSSNGSIRDSISVSPSGTYIFEYLRAYGTQNVRLHNYGFGVTG